MTVFPRVLELLEEHSAAHIQVTGGGIIPDEDIKALQAQGVGRLFGPGSSLEEIVAHIRALVAANDPEPGSKRH